MRRNAAPIIAIALLLLPVLYVGSYLALVVPEGRTFDDGGWSQPTNYRLDSEWPRHIFWPLKEVDRSVRKGLWYP